MKILIIIRFIMLFVVLLAQVNASDISIHPDLLTPVLYSSHANNRLENKEINALVQDEQGFIWLGTTSGLFRFDGYEYSKITGNKGGVDISNIFIRSLYAGRDDILWISAGFEGLFRLDLKIGHIKHYQQDTSLNSIGGSTVNSVIEDADGMIWIAHERGLDKLDPNTKQFSHYYSSENATDRSLNGVGLLAIDNNGTLWLSTGKGLAKFDHKKQSFARIPHNTINTPENSPLNRIPIRNFHTDQNNRLWIATQKQGSYILDPSNGLFELLPSQYINDEKINTDIVQPNEDEIWISGYSGIEIRNAHSGVLIKTLHSNRSSKYGLGGEIVHPMLLSRSGLLWLGVRHYGLQFFNTHNQGFQQFDDQNPNISPLFTSTIHNTVKVSEHEILIMSHTATLLLDLISGQTSPFFPDSLNKEWYPGRVKKTSKNVFWFGGFDGDVLQLDNDTKIIEEIALPPPNVRINSFAKDETGAMWIATSNSLYRISPHTKEIEKIKGVDNTPFSTKIRQLFFDSQQRLWIATVNGLGLFDKEKYQVVKFIKSSGTSNTLSHNFIVEVTENPQGDILVNTSSGIDKLTSQSEGQLFFEPFAEEVIKRKRLSDLLYSSPQGGYWYGLQFHLNKEGEILTEFSAADGAIKTARNGKMKPISERLQLFSSAKNITLIDLPKIEIWQYQPPIVITQLSKGNEPFMMDENDVGLHISSEKNEFSVRFAALDFTSPMDNLYRYKLEGFDDEWRSTPADIRQAKYTSLPPGKYQLLLDGTNRNGDWSLNPLKISVTVEPTVFQTTRFKFLLFIIISLLIYASVRWQVSRLAKKEHLKNEMYLNAERAEMMSELMDQKNKMLAEVTHDLRTPLTNIKMQLEALEDGALQHSEKSYGSLQKKLGNLNQMVGDLYQLSLVESGSLVLNKQDIIIDDLLAEAIESFQPLVQRAKLTINYVNNIKGVYQVSADAGRLSQVFNNLLKNSIRYTDPRGCIQVQMSVEAHNIVIVFEDSSPGVKKNELAHLFVRSYQADATRSRSSNSSGLGLSIVNSIINAHDGTVTAQCSNLGGIKIVIMLPIIS